MLNTGDCDMTGGCDTCYIQAVVIQEVVIHVKCRRL